MLNTEQRIVVQNPEGIRSVVAGPGSGKSTTMVELIRDLMMLGVSAGDIKAVTFSREMASALEKKLGVKGVVSTFHSLGYLICSELERKPVEPELRYRLMMKLVRKRDVDFKELDSFIARMRRENVAPHQAMEGEYDYMLACSYAEYENARLAEGWMDFDSMLADAVKLLENPQVRARWQQHYLIVDEAQDTDNCHPSGTLVRRLNPKRWSRGHTAQWENVPIETLKDGDCVVSWNRRHSKLTADKQPISISTRPFTGQLIQVHCGEKMVEVTPDHQFYVTLNGRESGSYVVYLMYRANLGFRVGQCTMRYERKSSKRRKSMPGLGTRFAEERAERGWILRVCSTKEESIAWEQIYSCNFGIPYATYGDKTYYSPHRRRTAAISATIFSSTHGRGQECLLANGLDFHRPLYERNENGQERKSPSKRFFVTSACNLRPEIMSLPSTEAFQQTPITALTRRPYDGLVYSLNVPKHHTYVANGIVVKNCQWRMMQLLSEKYGNITVVGDPGQCQPAGTMVRTPDGVKDIARLQTGETVLSWTRHDQRIYRKSPRVVTKASRFYRGDILTVRSNNRSTRVTPNHYLWVKFDREALKKKSHFVYLMWRPDLGFRVGTSVVRYSRDGGCFLTQRFRHEHAERMWILQFAQTKQEAEIWEEMISLQYRIPECMFVTHGSKKTSEQIAMIFDCADPEGGYRCLRDRHLLFEYPIVDKSSHNHFRGYFKIAAANLLRKLMVLPTEDVNGTAPVDAVDREPFCGTVYSLEVAQDHTYVADGIPVGNCIYSFRGAKPENITNIEKWFPGARKLYLGKNYRSTETIVNFIKENSPKGTPPELLARMVAAREVKGAPIALKMYWTDDAEAESALKLAQTDPLNSVILARTNRMVGLLERLCARYNLRYHLMGKSGLWKQNEVRKAVDALKDYPNVSTEAAFNLVLPALKSKYAVDDRTDKDNDALENLEVLRLIGKKFQMAREFAVYANKMMHRRNDPKGVSISTVHQAKGGEWKNVYIIGASAKGFPHPKGDPLEEERIWYVAISRAIDVLRISFAGTPSVFLRKYLTDEILDKLRLKAEEVDTLETQNKLFA